MTKYVFLVCIDKFQNSFPDSYVSIQLFIRVYTRDTKGSYLFISAKKQAYLFRGTLFLAMLSVFILTLMKPTNLPQISLNDKLAHLFAFGILAFLADFSFTPNRLKIIKTILLLSFGLIIEVTQSFTSWRTAEWQDVVADLIGVLIYWLIVFLILKGNIWRKKHKQAKTY